MNKRRPPAFPLDLLRGFDAVARHLSFTRAAEELHLTQSAVSRQIALLEERLGVALFARRTREVALTDAGAALHRDAGAALRQLDDAVARVRSASVRGVTVTCSVGVASLWLLPRLPALRAAHPEIDVRIAADNRVVDLERAGVDVAIRYGRADQVPPGTPRLFDEQVVPVCSPRLARRTPLRRVADLSRHVLLHYDDPDRRWPFSWPVWLETHGAAELKAAGHLHFSHYDQVIAAALAGHGVALGREPLTRDLLRERRLVAPLGARSDSERGYFLLTSSRSREEPRVRQFVDWIGREVAAGDAAAAGAVSPARRPAAARSVRRPRSPRG
ncbi:MAG: LysR substrate-binding domain-containing protein [Pseudomonadota bacterium]